MRDWKEAIRTRLAAAQLDPTLEAEVIEELAQHLEDRYQELQAGGVPGQECCSRLQEELEGCDLVARAVRHARRPPRSGLALAAPAGKGGYTYGGFQDLKLAFRNIRTKPSFALMVIGLLALGIAGNAAMFSVFNSLFLRPLPFAGSDRLLDLDETAPKWNLKFVGISATDYFAWSAGNETLDSMAAFRGQSFNLSLGGIAERARGVQVSHEMMNVLRLKPLLGRNFSPEEDQPGGAKVVMLSYRLWRRMFESDRNVLGRIVKLDDQGYTVIGVLPPEAVFPDRAELWTALAADPTAPSGYYLSGVGRLKSGVSIQQARADLLRVHRALISEGHSENKITAPVLTPLRDRYLGDFKVVSQALFSAVGLVLLIACVNIAALMLVRSSFRSREFAIRAVLGASRGRIVAQLLTEDAVLAGIGSVLGISLGAACVRAVASLLSEQMPQWVRFSLDGRFALFCIAISGAAVLVFGLLPALQASRTDIRVPLQNAAARATASRGQRTVLNGFVACEIGLALMLSISADLLLQSFRRVLQTDPGFRPENVLTFRISIPDAAYDKPEKKVAYYDKLLERLRILPGVTAAGATSSLPFGGQWGGQFEVEGGRLGPQDDNPVCLRVAATPGYVESMGMTLLDGRTFEPADGRPNSQLVVLVNETFAKYFWGDGSPVGKRIRYRGAKDWFQVIGFLRDEKHYGVDQEMKPGVFLPYTEAVFISNDRDARAFHQMNVVLRSSLEPGSLVATAREILRQLDPEVPMYDVHTMTEELDRSLWVRRTYSWLFGVFAAVAILLAAAGVYGTISHSVSQRRQEIGIRMALGARPGQVLRQVLLGGMTVVMVGVVAGSAGALFATRLLQTLLFHVNSRDPFIYVGIVIGVVALALVANVVPARRAAALDPVDALRFE